MSSWMRRLIGMLNNFFLDSLVMFFSDFDDSEANFFMIS